MCAVAALAFGSAPRRRRRLPLRAPRCCVLCGTLVGLHPSGRWDDAIAMNSFSDPPHLS